MLTIPPPSLPRLSPRLWLSLSSCFHSCSPPNFFFFLSLVRGAPHSPSPSGSPLALPLGLRFISCFPLAALSLTPSLIPGARSITRDPDRQLLPKKREMQKQWMQRRSAAVRHNTFNGLRLRKRTLIAAAYQSASRDNWTSEQSMMGDWRWVARQT